MRAPSHHRVLPAMVAVLVVVVAGCSDPTPAAKVPRRPAASTTAAAAPVESSPAKLTPEQEVEAAVRTYYAELTRAAQTNDTSKLKKLVHKGCPCYRAIRVIEENASRGETTPRAQWILRDVNVHDLIGGTVGAEVHYTVTAYDVIDRRGKVITHIGREVNHLDLSLVRVDDRWVVANFFNLEAQ